MANGIQVLLLVTAVLSILAARRGLLRDERVRARLVGVAACGYTGVFAVLTWQARRGQSVIHPDAATVLAFAGVAVAVLVAVMVVVTAARRNTSSARDAAGTAETASPALR
ncbi:hypothetical protein [Catellatospora chokoriensis]|uniref:Uncharacterized protein n=1 Tax=Catellatospora chokoriensis TaxID=310353 RepID=A0A8J3K952_9ACTN|nr:hypothetical protein Cch02nite_58920 [Catellatospora chokoriensis]